MNKVFISGHLTKDVEIRQGKSGKKYAWFSIGVDAGDNRSIFPDFQAWDKTAELMAAFLSKGSKILVEGRYAEYQAEDMTKPKKSYIIADRVEFLDTKKKEEPTREPKPSRSATIDIDVDDLPFM